MASPGLLFLVLVSSCLLLSTLSVPAIPGGSQKTNKGISINGQAVADTFNLINTLSSPFLGLIPVHGSLVAAISSLALGVAVKALQTDEVLDALNLEFQSLNIKLEQYHSEQKYEIWTAGAFHKPEVDLKNAWSEYETLAPLIVKEQNKQKKEELKNTLISKCEEAQSAFDKLHQYLTAEKPDITENLAKSLAAHFNCHEIDIKVHTMHILRLLYMGNTLSRLLYKLKNLDHKELLNKIADKTYKSAAALFQTQKNCIDQSLDYAMKDVQKLMDDNKALHKNKRQELSSIIWSFLASKYSRYDWMVVAYKTKHSNRWFNVMNQHNLYAFSEVEEGKVTIAVARQVKGTHTKADEVVRAIKRCIPEAVDCHKISDKLKNCKEIKESQPYSAVHAYLDKSHMSHDANQVGFHISPDQAVPFVLTGLCKKYKGFDTGKFVILIKSDEELKAENPCTNMNCGKNGKCIRMKDNYVGVCECDDGYYGPHCQETLEEYKKNLLRDL